MRLHCSSSHRPRPWPVLFALLWVSAATAQTQNTALPLKRDDIAERSGPTDLTRFTLNASHYYFGPTEETTAPPLRFLPPRVPPLYSEVPLRSPLDNGVVPPAELGAHIGDPFYPQLAAQLAADSLPRHLRVHLDAFRTDRHHLQQLLLARIREPAGADAGALDEQIEKLETSAEQLRHELGSTRPGRPAPQAPGATGPTARASYLRSIAFHLDGLSGDQRRLLRTAADSLEAPADSIPAVRLFVTPEGGRIVLPAGTPTALLQTLADYSRERDRMLGELLQGVATAADLEKRQAASHLAALVETQAPAFLAIARQADAIRDEVRLVLDQDQQTAPGLPDDLGQRLAAYQEHKQALFHELYASLPRAPDAPSANRRDTVVVPASAFSAAQQEKLAALKAERAALRAALVEHRRRSGARTDRKSVDDLLEEFVRAREREELRQKYRIYRDALLRPDLSPAERRLLLDCALQALQLPLPSGEPVTQP